MITSKDDLKYYISEDRKRYNIRFFDRFIFNESYFIFDYLKTLRRVEYLTNKRKSLFEYLLYYYYFWLYKRKGFRLNIQVALNSCGPGLFITHKGPIIVVANARVGSNCVIGPGVVLGTKDKFDSVPVVGDNVEICLGAKLIGNVQVGNNVIIAPNSVVIKDIPDNMIVSGIPAVIIKSRSGK